jgi:ATP-binding cassette subfamily C protein CydC
VNLAATPHVRRLILAQRQEQAGPLALAGASTFVAAGAATLLLGISGWFITGAALAGAGGLAVAQAFNFLLPSATVRLMAIFRTGFRYVERIEGHDAALRALAKIRPAIFHGLAASPPAQALTLSGGEASARLMQDVGALETLFVRLSLPWTVTGALATGLGLCLLAGWGSAAGLGGYAALTMLTAWLGAKRLAAGGAELQVRAGELKDMVAVLLNAAPELRCYGLESWASDEIDRLGRALGDAQLREAGIRGRIGLVQALILGLGVASVMALASAGSTPLLALAGLAAAMTLESLGAAVRAILDTGAALEAARRLEPLLAHGFSRPSPPQTDPELQIGPFHLAPGQRIAITGISGSGKTTLFERLIGLRPAPEGAIRAGGVDLAGQPAGFARSLFAYAPQEAALLAGTVRENLALAMGPCDDGVLWAALADACLDARIRRMPQGLDTWIGENGACLSGGERRRLSLARAFLRPADWLLLDEPTEGLDADTEAAVLFRLRRRLDATGQGLLIASHRPAAIRLCERQVAVDPVRPALKRSPAAMTEAA